MTHPCAANPAVFDSHGGDEDLRVLVAKALCSTCPTALLCRTVARENREWGVWGGESERERAWAGYPCIQPHDPDAPAVSLVNTRRIRRRRRRAGTVIGPDGRALCPSVPAYKRHLENKEDPGPCGCRDVHSAVRRAERKDKPKKLRILTPCPSEAAYKRHRRRGEDAEDCGCLAHIATVWAEARAKKKKAA